MNQPPQTPNGVPSPRELTQGQNPQQENRVQTVHVCFSGSLSCSGISPCPKCWEVVHARVMSRAMHRGGFNQDPRQAEAFFNGLNEGFAEVHQQMQTQGLVGLMDGPRHFTVIDLSDVLEELRRRALAEVASRSQSREPMAQQAPSPIPTAPIPPVTEPVLVPAIKREWADEVGANGGYPHGSRQEVAPTGSDVVQPHASTASTNQIEIPSQAPKPLTAAEIAATIRDR